MGMRAVSRRVLVRVCLAGAAGLLPLAVHAVDVAERDAARAERAALRERIQAIEAELARAEQRRAAAADELKASEVAISEATRKLGEIQARREQAGKELAGLERDIARLQKDLTARQHTLAELLRRQYQSGGATPWSAMLSGEDPQQAGRTLGYLGYVSQARAAAVASVRKEIAGLEQVQAQAAQRRAELDALAREHEAQRVERVRQQAERKKVLAEIGERLAAQRSEASRLVDDETRLAELITRINRELERQAAEARKRAEEEARRQREAELARARAEAAARAEAQRASEAARRERERLAREAAEPAVRATLQQRGAQPAIPVPEAPAERPAAVAPEAPSVEAVPQPVAVVRPAPRPESRPADFGSLRGRLSLPARGPVTGRFGEPREGGSTWRGVFIRTPAATPVHAVAGGTVVFSGWLRGFGNLLIVDHGNEYLSVYGNSEAILKQVGDPVRAGEAVASAGSSGGTPESGIYFELRHRGSPVDPLQWAGAR